MQEVPGSIPGAARFTALSVYDTGRTRRHETHATPVPPTHALRTTARAHHSRSHRPTEPTDRDNRASAKPNRPNEGNLAYAHAHKLYIRRALAQGVSEPQPSNKKQNRIRNFSNCFYNFHFNICSNFQQSTFFSIPFVSLQRF